MEYFPVCVLPPGMQGKHTFFYRPVSTPDIHRYQALPAKKVIPEPVFNRKLINRLTIRITKENRATTRLESCG